jgi:hypothetical protein
MSQKIVFTKRTFIAVLLLSMAAFVSCEKYVWEPPKVDNTIPVSFQNEIVPIFTVCKGCHGPSFPPNFASVATLIDGGFINTTTPESSQIYQRIVSGHHSSGVSEEQKQKLLIWIQQGAQNN